MKLRRLVTITNGHLRPIEWLLAACQEPPVKGKPVGCDACPLRAGGEWEDGARAALATMNATQRNVMQKRWGCHAAERPCAGMARICAGAP